MKETPTEYLKISEPPIIKGRPIVGGPNCPTNKLSNLIDLILKPLVYKLVYEGCKLHITFLFKPENW